MGVGRACPQLLVLFQGTVRTAQIWDILEVLPASVHGGGKWKVYGLFLFS